MQIPEFESGGGNYYQARLTGPENVNSFKPLIGVSLKKLDSLFADRLKRVAFMKVDVEGHELQAIDGAKNLISALKPALLIEMSGNLDDHHSPAWTLLRQLQDLVVVHEGRRVFTVRQQDHRPAAQLPHLLELRQVLQGDVEGVVHGRGARRADRTSARATFRDCPLVEDEVHVDGRDYLHGLTVE